MSLQQVLAKVWWAAPVAWLLAVAPGACAQGLVAQEGSPLPSLPRSELSLDKSGDLQTPTDLDQRTRPIAPPTSFDDEEASERSVTVPAASPPPTSQSIPTEVLALDSNMAARVNDVLACRLEIATDRRVPVSQVPAGSVLLRWTITPGGTVTAAEAVATRKTDPDVLSCARRKVESWVFVRAPGGQPLLIQQPLRFD